MRFIRGANQLTIGLTGMEQVWALKRRIQIPHYAIEDVRYVPERPPAQTIRGFWRIPGTSVPFRFKAGTFRRKGRREFWYMHSNQPGLLTIELKPGTLNYETVRITCAPEIAQDVIDWWQVGSEPRAADEQ